MPIYEYICPKCNTKVEVILKINDKAPLCPQCGISMKKLISSFSFRTNNYIKEREKSIMKLTRDYLIDGKIDDARRFINKAQEYVKTDNIKKIADKLNK